MDSDIFSALKTTKFFYRVSSNVITFCLVGKFGIIFKYWRHINHIHYIFILLESSISLIFLFGLK